MKPTESFPAVNVEAEQALLGAILVNNDAYYLVSGYLTDRHFSEPLHQEIYRLLERAIGLGRKASPKTLIGSLPSDLKVGEMSAGQYVAHLAAEAAGVAEAGNYGQVIFENALERELLASAARVIGEGGRGYAGDGIEALLSTAEADLLAIRRQLNRTDDRSTGLAAAADALVAEWEDRKAGNVLPVPSTGFPLLDKDLGGGYRPGRLIVLAARPGMGKTVFLVETSRRVAKASDDFGVALFSLEVDAPELTARIIASEMAREYPLAYRDALGGDLDNVREASLRDGRRRVQDYAIHIDAGSGLSMAEIEARARLVKERYRRAGKRLGLIGIDYLGLVKATERYRGKKVDEVGEIALAAKEMAKRLECCVLLLAQLNRSLENREDKRPTLSDLRDSGNIEEHADVVSFLYREAYYLSRTAEYARNDVEAVRAHSERENDLDFIIAKNRLGPTISHQMWCDVGLSSVDAKDRRHQ